MSCLERDALERRTSGGDVTVAVPEIKVHCAWRFPSFWANSDVSVPALRHPLSLCTLTLFSLQGQMHVLASGRAPYVKVIVRTVQKRPLGRSKRNLKSKMMEHAIEKKGCHRTSVRLSDISPNLQSPFAGLSIAGRHAVFALNCCSVRPSLHNRTFIFRA